MRLLMIGGLLLSIIGGSAAHAQRPGELISAEPMASPVAASRAWRTRYWTRDDRNRAFQATGIVVAPDAPAARARDVLAWTHGTWGIADNCAPSLSPNFGRATPALQAVARGMTVVAPDYIGLGSGQGDHPFLVGVATGRAVVDGVRAARSIKEANAGPRFAVWGESQGGHAALWTAQVQPRYAPELQLIATAAAAPPTDLRQNLREAPNAATRAFFTAYIGQSWSAHYGVPVSTFAGPLSRSIIQKLSKRCIVLDAKPKLGTILGIASLQHHLRNTDLAAIPPWSNLALTNSPQVARFASPVMIAQNMKDDLVAPEVTRRYAQALCRAGQPVHWLSIQGSGHATSAKDSAVATLAWIADRFAGKRAPSDCGKF